MQNTAWELLESLIAPAFLALVGGIARVCKFGFTSWRQFACSLIVSAFSGVIVSLFLQDAASIPESVKYGLCGMSGYSGGAILDGIVNRITTAISNFKIPSGTKSGPDAS